MLTAVVQSLFATYNLQQYDFTVLSQFNLPQSLIDAIEEAQRTYGVPDDTADKNRLKLTQDFGGFDDWNAPSWTSASSTSSSASGLPNRTEDGDMFSREEPYNFDEQRAIDQKGFLYPDYCVCRRPDLIQTPLVCKKQADYLRDPSLQPIYPNNSEQIKWVNETFVPYDLCYDHWSFAGVEYTDGTK